jgi:hypothetical protein
MRVRAIVMGVAAAVIVCAVAPAAEHEATESKIVAFCKKHLGEQVGSGECAALAKQALDSVGAKTRWPEEPAAGDYTWGKLILTIEHTDTGIKFTGHREELAAGDVLQYRDAKFQGKKGKGHYTQSMPHHTAVVSSVEDKGETLKLYQQNTSGKRFVTEGEIHLEDLSAGWVRVYRPVEEGAGK